MIKKYDFFRLLQLVFFKVRTILLFSEARLIRFPFDVRGKRFIKVSKGFTTGFGCRLEAYPTNNEKVLLIGRNVQINDYVHITAREKVEIGNNVLIASKIYISDCLHGSYSGDENDSDPNLLPVERPLFSKPVVIKDNVWLGESVSVLPGVTIGKGSIVGANSVVTKSLPDYVIAVGVPARIIKKYNFQEKIWEKTS